MVLDEEGYGYIVGRVLDMIIRGRENIYPAEIEQFLYTHPKIADVQVGNYLLCEVYLWSEHLAVMAGRIFCGSDNFCITDPPPHPH